MSLVVIVPSTNEHDIACAAADGGKESAVNYLSLRHI
jgi:hypothetical protein